MCFTYTSQSSNGGLVSIGLLAQRVVAKLSSEIIPHTLGKHVSAAQHQGNSESEIGIHNGTPIATHQTRYAECDVAKSNQQNQDNGTFAHVQRSMPGALQQDDPAMTLAERGIVRPFEERAGPNRQLPTLMGGDERRRK
jgi:hypothetical protein